MEVAFGAEVGDTTPLDGVFDFADRVATPLDGPAPVADATDVVADVVAGVAVGVAWEVTGGWTGVALV